MLPARPIVSELAQGGRNGSDHRHCNSGFAVRDRVSSRPKLLRNEGTKDGKTLAGAARTSSIKKCCVDSALSADGKKLSGAAKTSYVKKCQADAG